ncbi:MAG: hypothetical protein IPL58_15690 [Betaproteobacteria bacterium]|uniref:Uncharacterized protein n=1 Tax=Candidatus Proximibacter danicus TaxID=2954365 RepID=A0A9D7PU27_9PROT|nr:hypothetical protein [Candidatus Proximibacter danicus]
MRARDRPAAFLPCDFGFPAAIFAVALVFHVFHEFTETGLLPIDNEYWHPATEPYAPEG